MTLTEIASYFALPGTITSQEEIPTGLINTTHLVSCGEERFILQSLNTNVFKRPDQVMENIALVTGHLAKVVSTRQLELVSTVGGEGWLSLEDGTVWRCFPFLENTRSFEKISSPDLAFRAAAAFGGFQAKLADLDASALHETIPDFHNTPVYLEKLFATAKEDSCMRLGNCVEEFDFITSRKGLASILVDAGLPLRITHNDTKISNILFPLNEDEAPVVIDLDTVMPGLALFDFGDLVRSAAAVSDESENDVTNIRLDPVLAENLKAGYLSTASAFLTEGEIALLDTSVKVITFELAIRFLTDYLLGDQYFKINSPDHNLRRARNQLALLKSM